MIDPVIIRTAPERYAREPDLQEMLTGRERVIVQDEIVRRWWDRKHEETKRRAAGLSPAVPAVARRLWRAK